MLVLLGSLLFPFILLALVLTMSSLEPRMVESDVRAPHDAPQSGAVPLNSAVSGGDAGAAAPAV